MKQTKSRNLILGVIIFTIVIALIAGLIFFFSQPGSNGSSDNGRADTSQSSGQDQDNQDSQSNTTRRDTAAEGDYTEEGFELEANYQGDNQWTYQIDGYKPTPCHQVDQDVVVQESFPEQVIVSVEITQPEGDAICTQVLEMIELTGEFSASEEAQVELVVNQ
jgi:hypothetical protein